MVEYLLTFIVAFLGTVLSGIVGGGGSLITAPFLIFVGVSPQISVATTKFASVGLALGALRKFWPSGHIHWNHVPYKVILGVGAAIAGPRILLEFSPDVIPLVMGGLMILSSVLVLISQKYGLTKHSVSTGQETLGYVLYFLTLTLQSAFGAGVGILRVFVLVIFFGLTILEAQATARTSGIVMSFVSLLSFMAYGIVDYGYGWALLLGGIGGGYVGTHIALKGGNKFVKILFSIFVMILGGLLWWRLF